MELKNPLILGCGVLGLGGILYYILTGKLDKLTNLTNTATGSKTTTTKTGTPEGDPETDDEGATSETEETETGGSNSNFDLGFDSLGLNITDNQDNESGITGIIDLDSSSSSGFAASDGLTSVLSDNFNAGGADPDQVTTTTKAAVTTPAPVLKPVVVKKAAKVTKKAKKAKKKVTKKAKKAKKTTKTAKVAKVKKAAKVTKKAVSKAKKTTKKAAKKKKK